MTDTTTILDNFVSVKPGQAYRLLPFGKFSKGGKTRELTPELARRFRLPHFKPPVKLGSHNDTTPAGGTIASLEVREDGLYAIPELTEAGEQAFARGDYRYHSPEVIWDETAGFENPDNGELITGPLIVGDALLHTPHLGEATALYSSEILEENMEGETVTVPMKFWDKLTARLFPAPEETPEKPPVEAEQYEAIQRERDEYKARIETLEAEAARKARVDNYAAQLAETKAESKPEILAGMTDEQAAWVVTQFKALTAQINTAALIEEKGSNPIEPTDPAQMLTARVNEIMAEKKLDYAAALMQVGRENPELVKNARKH